MDRDRRRRSGLAGILGAVGLIVYVVLKEFWIPTVGGMGAFEAAAGFSFHFFEVAPMAFLTVGLLGFYAVEPDLDLAGVGSAVAAAGAATATVGHATEHVLFYFGSPVGYVFTGTHYLGLGLVGVGLTVAGLRVRPSPIVGARSRALLVSTLPVAVLLAAVLGSLWFRSFADGYKVHVAVVVAVVGYRLRRPLSGIDAVGAVPGSNASR